MERRCVACFPYALGLFSTDYLLVRKYLRVPLPRFGTNHQVHTYNDYYLVGHISHHSLVDEKLFGDFLEKFYQLRDMEHLDSRFVGLQQHYLVPTVVLFPAISLFRKDVVLFREATEKAKTTEEFRMLAILAFKN